MNLVVPVGSSLGAFSVNIFFPFAAVSLLPDSSLFILHSNLYTSSLLHCVGQNGNLHVFFPYVFLIFNFNFFFSPSVIESSFSEVSSP